MRVFVFLVAIFLSVFSSVSFAKVVGPTKGLDSKLMANLHKMSKHFRKTVVVTPHGGCRIRGSKRAPKSYHRIAVGCKAADVVIEGVSKISILKYWKKNFGGGVGYYCNRPFAHVDVGPDREWVWFCDKRTMRVVLSSIR